MDRELTIASALDSFDGETEARICAFLDECEAARLRGDLLGWQFGLGPRDDSTVGWVTLLLPTGEVIESKAPTLSKAIVGMSRKLSRRVALGGMVLPKA